MGKLTVIEEALLIVKALPGVIPKISRSVSGRPGEYVFADPDLTDDNGRAKYWINAGGYWSVRIGDEQWNSIPVNDRQQVTVDLPMGSKADVVDVSPLIVGVWKPYESNLSSIIERDIAESPFELGELDSVRVVDVAREVASGFDLTELGPVAFRLEDSEWSVQNSTLTTGYGLECGVTRTGDRLKLSFTRDQFLM